MKLMKTLLQIAIIILVGVLGKAGMASAETFYLHTDHLGSTAVVTNTTGSVAQATQYFPFGEILTPHPSPSPQRGEGWGEGAVSFQFTGKDLDREAELYYYEARYQDPILSRFLSVDPLLFRQPMEADSYLYVQNNPLRWTDPQGWASDEPDSGHSILNFLKYLNPARWFNRNEKEPPQGYRPAAGAIFQYSRKEMIEKIPRIPYIIKASAPSGGSIESIEVRFTPGRRTLDDDLFPLTLTLKPKGKEFELDPNPRLLSTNFYAAGGTGNGGDPVIGRVSFSAVVRKDGPIAYREGGIDPSTVETLFYELRTTDTDSLNAPLSDLLRALQTISDPEIAPY
ncbi:MAG: RHS repeat-associated core domain-containing protein [Deltaproteobacteria bacterium]|nr:RHS repeat-associated core domain-containing protein [Deltaproteobacteria bacterium]